ncbi:MAG: TRAP transporter small permease [Gammaproteobacteria bacterium]|jgi:TRAP-type C4-dicarboxylate transport system permease small subunit|nr:TRAP transporter small permease [Gammaproteobacteria bacterium]
MTSDREPETDKPVAASHTDRLAKDVDEASRQYELSDPDSGLRRIDRIVNKTVEALGVGVLCTMVGVIFINASGRYAFDAHIVWAEELVLLLMPWLAMSGLFLAIRRGTMIRIDFFFDKLPRSTQRILAPAGYLLCVTILFFIGWISTEYVLLFGNDRTTYLDTPKGASTTALVIGGFGGAIAFLVVLYREYKRRRGGPTGDG